MCVCVYIEILSTSRYHNFLCSCLYLNISATWAYEWFTLYVTEIFKFYFFYQRVNFVSGWMPASIRSEQGCHVFTRPCRCRVCGEKLASGHTSVQVYSATLSLIMPHKTAKSAGLQGCRGGAVSSIIYFFSVEGNLKKLFIFTSKYRLHTQLLIKFRVIIYIFRYLNERENTLLTKLYSLNTSMINIIPFMHVHVYCYFHKLMWLVFVSMPCKNYFVTVQQLRKKISTTYFISLNTCIIFSRSMEKKFTFWFFLKSRLFMIIYFIFEFIREALHDM